jgi:hypothetical protein
MNTLTLELTGGIGNQLFSYAYARYLTSRFNLQLVLDGSITERVLGRPADIFEFALGGESQLCIKDYSTLGLNTNRLMWKYPILRSLSNRKQSQVLSWDSDFLRYKSGGRLRGLFQGAAALEAVEKDKNSLYKLKNSSSNFKMLSKEINEKQVLSIHFRRGDYRNYQDNFWLLSAEYYQSAFNQVSHNELPGEVWLFSDEPETALSELNKVGIKIHQIVAPNDISVAETLKLMSLSKYLISANSTFSWWAGALGEAIEVISPRPWYRTEDDWLKEIDLIPSNWERHPAVWAGYEK